jgi:hypothetical protein
MRNQVEVGVFEQAYIEEARQGRRTRAAASVAAPLLGRWKVKGTDDRKRRDRVGPSHEKPSRGGSL